MKENSFFIQALAIFFLLTVVSCKKDNVPGEENPPAPTPKPPVENMAKTEKGQSLGAAITKMIGKEGGTIELPSKAILLTIPAEALQENTTIGIEPIANTNPASVGIAYRLTPANIKLSKPVTISFSVENIKDDISVAEAVAVARQNEQGYWYIIGGAYSKNRDSRVIVQTTHLGDIGPVQWLFITPMEASVFVNTSIELQAFRYIPAPADPDDYLVVPLVPPKEGEEIPMLNPTPLESKYIKNWELGGPGILHPNGNKAQYQAFSSILAGNSAAVSVELKTKTRKLMLVSKLTIITDEYLRVKVNGGAPVNLIGVATMVSNDGNVFGIAGALPDDHENIPFVLNGKANKGVYPWDDDNIGGDNATDAHFQYMQPSGSYYVDWFEPENGNVFEASPGGLHIQEISTFGEYVTGTFSASSAGMYNASHTYAGTGRIEGEFKVLLLDLSNSPGIATAGQNKWLGSLQALIKKADLKSR